MANPTAGYVDTTLCLYGAGSSSLIAKTLTRLLLKITSHGFKISIQQA
jgi:hypothetical protein